MTAAKGPGLYRGPFDRLQADPLEFVGSTDQEEAADRAVLHQRTIVSQLATAAVGLRVDGGSRLNTLLIEP